MEKSAKTLALYKRLLDELKTEFGTPDLSFAKDTQKVISYIEGLDKAPATRKLYYAVLVATLRDLKTGRTKLMRTAEDIYRLKMFSYNDALQAIAERQEMSEREQAIWVNWEDVLSAHQKLKRCVETNKNPLDYLDYVLLSLYTLVPPIRADWSPVIITTRMEGLEPKRNYLVVGEDKVSFVLQDYKTVASGGIRCIELPKSLEDIIRWWLTMETSGYLFSDARNQPRSSEWLSKEVRNMMKRRTGKPAGINILRHSYITHMRAGEAPVIQQRNMANSMCHSVNQSQLYRRI